MQKKFWERSALRRRRSASHPVVSEYSNSKIALILKKVDILRVNNILEVGCGNGFLTSPLSQRFDNVVGLDFSQMMLSLITTRNFSLICADAINLPFKDLSFDLVLSSNLLHHVENIERPIREMKRVSRKYIVIIEPNKKNFFMYLFSMIRKEEDYSKFFTLSKLKTKINSEKISIIDAFSTGFITPNRTPQILTPFLKEFNVSKNRFGMYNVIIGAIS